MADLNFDKIMTILQEIHELFPEMRFGQVLQQAADVKKASNNKNLNDMNSKEILLALEEFKSHHQSRRGIA